MKYLLDTHIWLWLVAEPQRLRPELLDILSDERVALYLSAASAWEIAVKHRLGRLPLPEPPAVFVPKRLIRDGILALPVQLDHALAVADLPDFHRDPFDRMLLAQARCERMTFVTADEAIFRYDVEILRAQTA